MVTVHLTHILGFDFLTHVLSTNPTMSLIFSVFAVKYIRRTDKAFWIEGKMFSKKL